MAKKDPKPEAKKDPKPELLKVKITHRGVRGLDNKEIPIGTIMGITPGQEIGWVNKYSKVEPEVEIKEGGDEEPE